MIVSNFVPNGASKQVFYFLVFFFLHMEYNTASETNTFVEFLRKHKIEGAGPLKMNSSSDCWPKQRGRGSAEMLSQWPKFVLFWNASLGWSKELHSIQKSDLTFMERINPWTWNEWDLGILYSRQMPCSINSVLQSFSFNPPSNKNWWNICIHTIFVSHNCWITIPNKSFFVHIVFCTLKWMIGNQVVKLITWI